MTRTVFALEGKCVCVGGQLQHLLKGTTFPEFLSAPELFYNALRCSANSRLVSVLHLSSSSLSQNTHCWHWPNFSLPQHDTDTAGRHVCGLHRGLIYIVSKRKREVENRVDGSLSLDCLSNLLHLSIVVAKCLAFRVIPQIGLQFLLFCCMSIRNTTPHIQVSLPTASCFPLSHY